MLPKVRCATLGSCGNRYAVRKTLPRALVVHSDPFPVATKTESTPPPGPLHGKSLFSKDVRERKYVFAPRDKMDETHDSMRAIRSKDHKLTLNLMPERPWCQYNRYKEAAYPVLAEMNVLNLQGKLTKQQAAFFAPTKPPIELFDLRRDPHEVNNLADDPKYAPVRSELLSELANWRKNVIHDKGVSLDFVAKAAFPNDRPEGKVDDWVNSNAKNYDFNKYGWPAWYPTRSLPDWQKAREMWAPYVFRSPSENFPRPSIVHSKKDQKPNGQKPNGRSRHCQKNGHKPQVFGTKRIR